ncbi:MAG TPA: hypothetical protein VF461_12175 [Gemmatimonadaceae bacterium]
MLVVMLTAGCSVWRPLPGAGFAHTEVDRLGHARVSRRGGAVHELEDATVTQDSIIGFDSNSLRRIAIARREVIGVDAREMDGERTFLLGALIPVSLTVVYIATLFALYAAYGGGD